jgi:two-component system sensor histidine kinase BaeS
LTNAIRYTSDSGKVTVATGAAQGYAQISICDTGPGIFPADLPHIFDQFYRADKSRTRRSGGSGIGLSIVKRLAEIHGGRVEVASKPGEGSCFTVYLPLGRTE